MYSFCIVVYMVLTVTSAFHKTFKSFRIQRFDSPFPAASTFETRVTRLTLSHREFAPPREEDGSNKGTEEVEEDRKLELEIARQQFDDLVSSMILCRRLSCNLILLQFFVSGQRDGGSLVSRESFLAWDDINDVITSGVLDKETIESVFDEVLFLN